MTQGSTPPGWYDDGRGGRRWWDGVQWAPEGQGPAPQPFSGGPGGPGPPGGRSGRSKAPLFAVIAVVAVALVAFAVTAFVAPGFLLSDDDDDGGGDTSSDSGPGDPAETVQDFVDAARDGGCEAAEEFVTESFFDESGGCDDEQFDAAGLEFEVGEAEVDGDEARVPLTFIETDDETGETSESTGDVLLVVVDDEWKIDGAEAESDSSDVPTD